MALLLSPTVMNCIRWTYNESYLAIAATDSILCIPCVLEFHKAVPL